MKVAREIRQNIAGETTSIHSVIGLLYDAAADSRKWPQFLQQLAQLTDQSFAVRVTREFWPDLLNPGVTLMRGVASPSDEFKSLHSILTIHLRRAISIRNRIQFLEKQQPILLNIWNQLTIGMLLVDGNCTLLEANDAARQILGKRDGLIVLENRVTAQNPANAAALKLAVTQKPSSDSLIWTYRQYLRPLGVVVHVLLPVSAGSPAAILYVNDPESGTHPTVEAMRRIYGFTAAEANLTRALVQGKTLEEYAHVAHISVNTARTHLKRALEKTDTSRQADLVRVLLTGPAIIRMD